MNNAKSRNKSILTIAVLVTTIILLLLTLSATSYALSRSTHRPSGDIETSIRGSYLADHKVFYEHDYSAETKNATIFFLTNKKNDQIVKGDINVTVKVTLTANLANVVESVAIEKLNNSSGRWSTLGTAISDRGITYSAYENKAFLNNETAVNYYRVVVQLNSEINYTVYTELYNISYSYSN